MSRDADRGLVPAFRPPPLACDSHFHVFGPAEHYPAGTDDLRYKLPFAPLDAYFAVAGQLGFERFVFVQPSAYGIDNSCMLDAMRQVGPQRCRGIVDIDETSIAEDLLQEWHRLGVRGVRVNVSPVRKQEAGLADTMRPRIRRLAALMERLGWHLDFLAPGWLVSELMDEMRSLPVDFTVAHLGLFPASDGPTQPGFRAFLGLVREGRCWVKLTGIYRMSTAPDFADVLPMARALLEARPDRVIWGSDFPHISFSDRVGNIQLFNKLAEWAPEEEVRRKILVDNPQALFGFADPA